MVLSSLQKLTLKDNNRCTIPFSYIFALVVGPSDGNI